MSTSNQINNKTEYYALARRGLLGNTLNQWTVDEFYEHLRINGYDGKSHKRRYAIRTTTPASRMQTYDLYICQIYAMINAAFEYKVRREEILICDAAPDDRVTFQGEVMRDPNYLYLRYNTTPGLRMREAYPIMQHVEGLGAVHLLRRHMDTASFEMLSDIFDRYPDAMVEFTCYDCRVGCFKTNTLFWEVRTGY